MASIVVLLWIVCGAFSAVLAKGKGRSPIGWLLMGSLLGILGPIVVALLPAVEPEQRSSAEPPPPLKPEQQSNREPPPSRSRHEIERENLNEFAVLTLIAMVALVAIAALIMTDAPSAFNDMALPGQWR
jgi:hypothetical protein